MHIEEYLKNHIICTKCYYDLYPQFLKNNQLIYFKENNHIKLECPECKNIFNIFDIKNNWAYVLHVYFMDKMKNDKRKNGYIYIIKMDNKYKIGRTINIEKRMMGFKCHSIRNYKLILFYYVYNYILVETEIHKLYKNKKIRNEWFNLNENEIIEIKNYLETRKLENNQKIKGDEKLSVSLKETGKKINEIISPIKKDKRILK